MFALLMRTAHLPFLWWYTILLNLALKIQRGSLDNSVNYRLLLCLSHERNIPVSSFDKSLKSFRKARLSPML